MVRAIAAACLFAEAAGHGHITFPPNRAGGNLSFGGLLNFQLERSPFFWFSQPMTIPGEPTLNDAQYRTYNVDVKDGAHDWSRKMPWRAPGQAPVRGSGCGVSGGADVKILNGGDPVPGYAMGTDGLELPEQEPTEWQIGGVATVGFAMVANHGGGYSWRLCKKSDTVDEACFQKTTLPFHGNHSWLHYVDIIATGDKSGPLKIPDVEIPRVTVPADQVHPAGSHWARNPIPSCNYCDQTKCGGLLPNMTERITVDGMDQLPENMSYYGGNDWYKQEKCAQQCSGLHLAQCPPGMTQFAEPAPGISSYIGRVAAYAVNAGEFGPHNPLPVGVEGLDYSVMDEVRIPEHLEEGEYFLSWRWDCEQSPQIWQQCADIKLVKPASELLV